MKTKDEGSCSSSLMSAYVCKKCKFPCEVFVSGTSSNPARQFYACHCSDGGIFRAWCDEVNSRESYGPKQLRGRQQASRHKDKCKDDTALILKVVIAGFVISLIVMLLLFSIIVAMINNKTC